MLSTNQKAKIINQKIGLIKTENELSNIPFHFKDLSDLQSAKTQIKNLYGIDISPAIIPMPGLFLINPIVVDEQIERKFNQV